MFAFTIFLIAVPTGIEFFRHWLGDGHAEANPVHECPQWGVVVEPAQFQRLTGGRPVLPPCALGARKRRSRPIGS
ncbi:MAG: hypothetical protein M3319_03545 [Actinomycetota bacterium]|nr:hypothetical protein [Actinomycetota bacterium]MDQ3899546.1 hypothetical protein [Actinomycetota bacterium]